MVQAEYSQSSLSRQQLQQRLDAFEAQSSENASGADAQRRGVLCAQAIHFLQPLDVLVSVVAVCSVLSCFSSSIKIGCEKLFK